MIFLPWSDAQHLKFLLPSNPWDVVTCPIMEEYGTRTPKMQILALDSCVTLYVAIALAPVRWKSGCGLLLPLPSALQG